MLSYYYNQFSLFETTPAVKSYPGHVYLPSGTTDLGLGRDYPINTRSLDLPQQVKLHLTRTPGPFSISKHLKIRMENCSILVELRRMIIPHLHYS